MIIPTLSSWTLSSIRPLSLARQHPKRMRRHSSSSALHLVIPHGLPFRTRADPSTSARRPMLLGHTRSSQRSLAETTFATNFACRNDTRSQTRSDAGKRANVTDVGLLIWSGRKSSLYVLRSHLSYFKLVQARSLTTDYLFAHQQVMAIKARGA